MQQSLWTRTEATVFFFPMPRRMTSPARVDGRFPLIRCRILCAATSSSSFRGSQTIDSTFSSRRSVKVRPSSCPYLFCPATDYNLPISAQTDDTWCRPTKNCTSCPSTRGGGARITSTITASGRPTRLWPAQRPAASYCCPRIRLESVAQVSAWRG